MEWTEEHAAALASSPDRHDRQIARVIQTSRQSIWTAGSYQVFLLSQPAAPEHRSLHQTLPHLARGRGSAFVQRHRYVSLHALQTATTTDDL